MSSSLHSALSASPNALDAVLQQLEATADEAAASLGDTPALWFVGLLHHWFHARANEGKHRSVKRAHQWSKLRWDTKHDADSDDVDRFTPQQLIRMLYAVTRLHDASLQSQFEALLVELKRHWLMDRLANDVGLDAFAALLPIMLPLAYPSHPAPAASADAHSVWLHRPSLDAESLEQSVAAELLLVAQSQSDSATLPYLASHPYSLLLTLLDEYLVQASEQWNARPAVGSPPPPAAPVASEHTSSSNGSSKKPSATQRKLSAIKQSAAASPSDAHESEWRWDHLVSVEHQRVDASSVPLCFCLLMAALLCPLCCALLQSECGGG